MERKEEIDVNLLKNSLLNLANRAFIESFDKGSRKYGDRWKTTGWTGIKGLADSKWDMFLNILDTGDQDEITHHASDMVAWITILAVRAINGITAEEKVRMFNWEDFDFCEETQLDCLMKEIEAYQEDGYTIVVNLPKPVPPGTLDVLLGEDVQLVIK